eukprot:scaffold219999_cov13-Tisochrysis_lutea.AAC.1
MKCHLGGAARHPGAADSGGIPDAGWRPRRSSTKLEAKQPEATQRWRDGDREEQTEQQMQML